MSTERVQKILAQAGITSRRKAEELITQGLVTINGKTAQLGDKAEWGTDAIKVEGKLLTAPAAPVYVAFHKGRNVISMMMDPQGRPTLADYLSKVKTRVFPIGRLDFTSEGLILLTNDGDFAEKIQRDEKIPRVYHVKVKGHPGPEVIERIQKGIRIGGRHIQPHSVRVQAAFTQKARIEIVIVGAGAMDVKSLFEMKGLLVERMVRTSIGHITLQGLDPGEFKYLTKSQVDALLSQPELGMLMIEKEQEHSPGPRLDDPREESEDGPTSRPAIRRRASTDREEEGQDHAERPRPAAGKGIVKRGGPRPEGRPGSFSKRPPRTGDDERPRRGPGGPGRDRPSRPSGFGGDRDSRGPSTYSAGSRGKPFAGRRERSGPPSFGGGGGADKPTAFASRRDRDRAEAAPKPTAFASRRDRDRADAAGSSDRGPSRAAPGGFKKPGFGSRPSSDGPRRSSGFGDRSRPAPSDRREGGVFKPRFGGGDKPRFGGGDKPRFGGGDKPRFGSGDKPRFGGSDRPRTGGSDRPRFGGGAGRSGGSAGGDRPGGARGGFRGGPKPAGSRGPAKGRPPRR